jgi:hypothetical protein
LQNPSSSSIIIIGGKLKVGKKRVESKSDKTSRRSHYLKQVENSIKEFFRDEKTISLEEVKKKLKEKSRF